MHIHILGICGTFMGSLAILAKQEGHTVTGADWDVYPPISDQLKAHNITIYEGYDSAQFNTTPDVIIIGNALSRGNPAVEYILAHGLPFMSGPQWLADYVLSGRWVMAVAGTHGKTTTAAILAWILEYAGLNPGFLIGGVPYNFTESARLGDSSFFVIEADEYDTAFFDKRPKFLHFFPKTLIINNIEFDHADIYPNLDVIKQQFHYLVRTVSNRDVIIAPTEDKNVSEVLEKGCWSQLETFGLQHADWQAKNTSVDGRAFDLYFKGKRQGRVQWEMLGQHNIHNAVAAIAASNQAGVETQKAIEALSAFKGVKRRLELRGQAKGVAVYDDFAHHPTAIKTTLQGLRAKVGDEKIIVAIEFASNSMRAGHYQQELSEVFNDANYVALFQSDQQTWDTRTLSQRLPVSNNVFTNIDDLIKNVCQQSKAGDHIVVMSNKSFGNIHKRLLDALDSVCSD